MRYDNYLKELIRAVDRKTAVSNAEAKRMIAEKPFPSTKEFLAEVDAEVARREALATKSK